MCQFRALIAHLDWNEGWLIWWFLLNVSASKRPVVFHTTDIFNGMIFSFLNMRFMKKVLSCKKFIRTRHFEWKVHSGWLLWEIIGFYLVLLSRCVGFSLSLDIVGYCNLSVSKSFKMSKIHNSKMNIKLYIYSPLFILYFRFRFPQIRGVRKSSWYRIYWLQLNKCCLGCCWISSSIAYLFHLRLTYKRSISDQLLIMVKIWYLGDMQ